MASHLRDADHEVDQVGGEFTLMATAVKKNKTEEREEEKQHETAAVEEYISVAACGWRVCPPPRGQMTPGHVSSKSDLHLIHSLAL